MILDEIILTNFGIYKGEHKVTLTPKYKKPIILFGAYNGSGKTTFLEALQLVLYGKSAKTAGRGKLPYDEYLESLINRDTPKKQGSGLCLRFRTRQDGKEESLEITRTWFESGNNIKENFQVIRNNSLDQIASERWNEFVEEIMPSQISELFFFDGEKIEGLADPLRSSSLLKTGIYSLLGINSIDNLIKSLNQIEKKKTVEIGSSSDQSLIEKEESSARELTSKKEIVEYEIANINNQIDKVNARIKVDEENMRISGGDLLKERHNLQNKFSLLNEQKRYINLEMIDLAGGLAPLLIINPLIAELRNEATKSSGHNPKTLELVEKEFSILLSRLIQKEFQTLSLDNSSSKLTQNISAILNEEVVTRIGEIKNEVALSSISIDLVDIPSCEEFEALEKLITQKINEITNNHLEIDIVNKNLLAVPSEEKVKDIINSLNENQKELIKLDAKLEMLVENKKLITDELDKIGKVISSKLIEIAEKNTESEINKRVISHIKKSIKTLSIFKESLVSKHIASLSHEITECFRLLHRKNKFELRFSINSNDFSLSIEKPNSECVPAKSLSAGERQLLAVAILWALAKSSGKTLPTVIDTPLGRLDGPHRKKLITNYFPKASNQVLIFSTDEEVTSEHYLALKPHISSEYKINYSEETESSSFQQGYF